jgi:DNA mismatch endonuclease, patch repair protein
MADTISKEKRSYVMSRIKGKNTKPEMLVRSSLHAKGFRFRLHKKDLPGKPDIVLPKYKTAIFVHGCFWHHHDTGCRDGHLPKSNVAFWEQKIRRNVERDKRNLQSLQTLGWHSIVIWECELKKSKAELTLDYLVQEIMS